MSSCHAPAMRIGSQPGCSGCENPNPGIDGITTWNASDGSSPCAAGSVSGPMMSANSTNDPGQPWDSSSGMASGCGERTCKK